MPGLGHRTNGVAAPDRVDVLVVDDHAELRSAICEIVAATAGMVVVGQTSSGEAAIDAADRLKPQLVIMDVCMRGIDGVEATRRITRVRPAVVVVLVSLEDVAPDVVRSCGATVFLRKQRLSPTALRKVWEARPTPSP